MDEPITDVHVDVVAIAYYLYRQAGCPHGDTVTGFDSWYKVNVIGEFKKFGQRAYGVR